MIIRAVVLKFAFNRHRTAIGYVPMLLFVNTAAPECVGGESQFYSWCILPRTWREETRGQCLRRHLVYGLVPAWYRHCYIFARCRQLRRLVGELITCTIAVSGVVRV